MRLENNRHVGEIDELKRNSNMENGKAFRIEEITKALEMEMNRNKSNQLMINDLKSTLSTEIKERSRAQKRIDEMESAIRRMEEEEWKMKEELRIYSGGISKFRCVITGKIETIVGRIKELNNRIGGCIVPRYSLNEENREFLIRLKISCKSFNSTIDGFRIYLADVYKRMSGLRKEAEGEKRTERTAKLIDELQKQFIEVKNELIVGKRYLEKKAIENKSLRNENTVLRREIKRIEGAARMVQDRQWIKKGSGGNTGSNTVGNTIKC
jgi:hypothetical protein